MNVIGFRMRSGEDIFAELVEERPAGDYVIRRPVVPVTHPHPNQQGQEMIRFLKWCPYSTTEEFEFGSADYVVSYKLPKELEDAYMEVTSSIQIARPGQVPK